MKKYKKYIVIIGLLLAVGLVSWYYYKRRKRPFEDYGRSDWAGDTSLANLAFRLSHKPSLKKDDEISIVFDNSKHLYPEMDGPAKVVDILTPDDSYDEKSYWIVTNKEHRGSGPQETGYYKKQ